MKDTNLLRTIPLSPVPLLIQKKLEVFVGDDSGRKSPWALETGSICVASSESVSPAQSNNFLVIKSHTSEDVAQMLAALGSVWQTSVGCAGCHILVQSTRSVWNDRALHLLDGDDSTENPEIGVGDPRKLLCEQTSASDLQINHIENIYP